MAAVSPVPKPGSVRPVVSSSFVGCLGVEKTIGGCDALINRRKQLLAIRLRHYACGDLAFGLFPTKSIPRVGRPWAITAYDNLSSRWRRLGCRRLSFLRRSLDRLLHLLLDGRRRCLRLGSRRLFRLLHDHAPESVATDRRVAAIDRNAALLLGYFLRLGLGLDPLGGDDAGAVWEMIADLGRVVGERFLFLAFLDTHAGRHLTGGQRRRSGSCPRPRDSTLFVSESRCLGGVQDVDGTDRITIRVHPFLFLRPTMVRWLPSRSVTTALPFSLTSRATSPS